MHFSLTAVAVRVLVGFNRVSIPTRIVRLQIDSAAKRSRSTFLPVLAALIRGASVLQY